VDGGAVAGRRIGSTKREPKKIKKGNLKTIEPGKPGENKTREQGPVRPKRKGQEKKKKKGGCIVGAKRTGVCATRRKGGPRRKSPHDPSREKANALSPWLKQTIGPTKVLKSRGRSQEKVKKTGGGRLGGVEKEVSGDGFLERGEGCRKK